MKHLKYYLERDIRSIQKKMDSLAWYFVNLIHRITIDPQARVSVFRNTQESSSKFKYLNSIQNQFLTELKLKIPTLVRRFHLKNSVKRLEVVN